MFDAHLKSSCVKDIKKYLVNKQKKAQRIKFCNPRY